MILGRVVVLALLALVGGANARKYSAPANFADIVQPLLPAVVNISTITEIKDKNSNKLGMSGRIPLEDLLRQFFEGQQLPRARNATSLGSGFIIEQKDGYGYVVTSNHVISGANKIKITLHNDREYMAEVVGFDKRTDIALLKFKTNINLITANWGDSSKIRVGEWIVAVGNPFGLSSTVTVGIISTIARDISARTPRGGADYVNGYIQTDAPINMGNSGGPMFDVNGKVQAISTAIFSPNGGNIGIGFGIPANLAKKVVAQLKKYGRTKRGWIGVSIQNITPEIAESLGLKQYQGALVGSVSQGGPGDKAGIKSQDVIIKFNNKVVQGSKNLPHMVGESDIGKDVPLKIWRNGKYLNLKIKIGEFEKAIEEGLIELDSNNAAEQKTTKKSVLGMVTKPITPGIKERYKLSDKVAGLFITMVEPNSEAFEHIIRAGDVIQQVTSQGNTIVPRTTKEFENFVNNSKKSGKKKILLLINTGGNLRYVALSLK